MTFFDATDSFAKSETLQSRYPQLAALARELKRQAKELVTPWAAQYSTDATNAVLAWCQYVSSRGGQVETLPQSTAPMALEQPSFPRPYHEVLTDEPQAQAELFDIYLASETQLLYALVLTLAALEFNGRGALGLVSDSELWAVTAAIHSSTSLAENGLLMNYSRFAHNHLQLRGLHFETQGTPIESAQLHLTTWFSMSLHGAERILQQDQYGDPLTQVSVRACSVHCRLRGLPNQPNLYFLLYAAASAILVRRSDAASLPLTDSALLDKARREQEQLDRALAETAHELDLVSSARRIRDAQRVLDAAKNTGLEQGLCEDAYLKSPQRSERSAPSTRTSSFGQIRPSGSAHRQRH